ncbi:Disulfide-bond oxidoreductase YfcG [Aquimixticola soesokkakensis]|uniref:Disulfide-bond oxidoreductase YfcG n=1 Tax=Aquimixticola soesokkakensis TaxID=1519096 RepID=A0A1Y5TQ95_9RHOB|nr:glutathione S-transferase [Aquimixticola soesokkakensis]SLN67537.1 Disulfide-bond oxidoreductase YfcG [Aquimixticola soesokkakensis]
MAVQLYCFGESGHSYKAALTLTLCGIDWAPVFVDFFNSETRSKEFRKLNVMGECPVLVEGSLVLSQSGAIQTWAADETGKLGGQTSAQAREVLRWLLWDNHKMSSLAGSQRFLLNFLHEEKRPQEVIRWQAGRLEAALGTLDAALQGREFLVGRDVTLADLACCSYLFYEEPFGFSRADWPAIDRWLDRIAGLRGWAHPYDMMPGSPADRA